jgi:general secretion pathway protein A
MFENFFEMKNTPFTRGIPVDDLYTDPETNEIHARLLSAAKEQRFALLVGDSGMGKTTAIRRLRSALSESEYTLLYIADSKLTPKALYNELLEQLGCPTKFQRIAARKALHRETEIMRGVGQQKLIVVVDEAHLLDRPMLEEIRFLLNIDMDSRNPMALILCGQTELWEKLHMQAYRAIWERVEIHAILQPYDLSQTKSYIQSQLAYSGFQGSIFSEDAQKLIFDSTSGVPRLINNICRNSLIYAYQNRRTIIDDRMVQQVIDGEG